MMTNPYEKLNDIKHTQLSSLNIHTDLQKKRSTKKWEKNRSELLENVDTCEWCGREPDSFDIHHLWNRDLSRMWVRASDTAFVESDAYDSDLTESREECPECSKKQYYARKTLNPKYKCSNCGETFDSPRIVDGSEIIARSNQPTKPYLIDEYEYMKSKSIWVNQKPEKVKESFMELYEDALDEYVSMRSDQVVAICSSCHYKEEQTNLKRCNKCGSNWHKRDKSICWDCLVEQENLAKCSECDSGWYSKDSYEKCSRCR